MALAASAALPAACARCSICWSGAPARPQSGSYAGRAVAGELGLEPRMTVPKTGVLPLHHSPAGPARPGVCPRGGGQIRQAIGGCNTPFSDYFSFRQKARRRVLQASNPLAISPPPSRSVAQSGRALPSGGRGRRFESSHSDHLDFAPFPSATAYIFSPPARAATSARCAPTVSIVRSPRAFLRARSSGDPAS